jgi:hypothetical protein
MIDLLLSNPDILASVLGAVTWFIFSVLLRYIPEPKRAKWLAIFNGAQRIFANFDRVHRAKEKIAADQAADKASRASKHA